ncbi:hypothetical protein SCOCK_370019 [Actinacidiphila cocklensis]|uniref:Uncharacterized protein n=1 Tax=Actinacidiphila cocklensis TaxID=887465 RepID=A0A9W4DTB7_9ACTN|nr:hypothetical protein SCOCK_370019 [Actinacidiphila cocklensis]
MRPPRRPARRGRQGRAPLPQRGRRVSGICACWLLRRGIRMLKTPPLGRVRNLGRQYRITDRHAPVNMALRAAELPFPKEVLAALPDAVSAGYRIRPGRSPGFVPAVRGGS